MKPIRVLVVSSSPEDGPAFFRSTGPLLSIPERYDVRLLPTSISGEVGVSWLDLMNVDVVHFPRPASKEMLQILRLVKASNVPVWVDFDDDLLNIPPDNPAFLEYRNDETASIIQSFVEQADLLTVSTTSIQQTMGGEVVKNALLPKLHKVAPVCNASGVWYWRGSETHAYDVSKYAAQIAKIGVPLYTFGWLPWPLIEAGVECKHVPAMPMMLYLQELRSKQPGVCVVPLVDNVFNRGKSNIAWLEATAAGAVTVAPGTLAEFQQPGVYSFDDLDKVLAASPEERQERWALSATAVQQQSADAHARRYELLKGLVQ